MVTYINDRYEQGVTRKMAPHEIYICCQKLTRMLMGTAYDPGRSGALVTG